MKKIFLVLLLFTIIGFLPAWSDDSGITGTVTDELKYTNFTDNPFAGQKQITDEEFQKTVDQLKTKQNKKKKKDKNQLKGKDFNRESSGGYIKEAVDNVLVLSLPVDLSNSDGTEIPVGMYKVVGKRVNEDVYLDFYQAYERIARVPAKETNSDFNESNINFVKLIPYDTKHVKVIFGSMDFNAYTYIKIKQNNPSFNN